MIVSNGGTFQEAQHNALFVPYQEKSGKKVTEDTWENGIGVLRTKMVSPAGSGVRDKKAGSLGLKVILLLRLHSPDRDVRRRQGLRDTTAAQAPMSMNASSAGNSRTLSLFQRRPSLSV